MVSKMKIGNITAGVPSFGANELIYYYLLRASILNKMCVVTQPTPDMQRQAKHHQLKYLIDS